MEGPWTVVGTLASLSGLIVSALAFWKAKRAAEAAEDARAAITHETLLSSLEDSEKLSLLILSALEHDEVAVARSKATDLRNELSWISSRWGKELGSERIREIERLRTYADDSMKLLREMPERAKEPQERGRIMREFDAVCQRIIRLRGELTALTRNWRQLPC